MKRIYYLLGIIGTIAVIGGIFYFLHYRAETVTPPVTTTETGGGALPPAAGTQPGATQPGAITTPSLPPVAAGPSVIPAPTFGLVSQVPTLNYFVDGQGNAIIVQPNGQIAKIAAGSGQASLISSSAIVNLANADFSYDGAKILATFGNISAPQASIFDVAGKFWQPLSAGIESVSWSSVSRQITYFANKNSADVLTVIDTADSKAKPVELLQLQVGDVKLFWPMQNKIVLADKPSSLARGSVWSFDVKQKTLTQITADALGLESVWADGADLGLIFRAGASGSGGSLAIVDTAGRLINNLSIFTLPSKCVFNTQTATSTASSTSKTSASSTGKAAASSSPPNTTTVRTTKNYLYCAIPKNANDLKNAALPDDYEMKKIFTSDDFYRIDLANGNLIQALSSPMQNMDAIDLKVFGGHLFFVNRYDQKLYWASLK